MHQKDLARQAWTRAGLYEDKQDVRLQRFLQLLDSPTDCWPEMVDQARANFTEYKARVARPLWESGDKLIRVNLIRIADLSQADELALLMEAATAADPVRDAPELRAMALRDHRQLLDALARKAELSPELRSLVERRIQAQKARAEAPAAASTPETSRGLSRDAGWEGA